MNKILKNQLGMTIVEVMVAGSIGVAVFMYINQAIIKINKSQTRFERKEMARAVKKNMYQILEDVDSWISNPESEVPKPSNNFNLYYFKSPGAEISKISFTEKEIVEIDKKIDPKGEKWKCPPSFESCRVVLWNYRNKLITLKNIKELRKNHFRVVIAIETEEKYISRAYLPEFKLVLTDTNGDSEISARLGIFHVNSTGSKRSGKSNVVEIDGRKVDVPSRTKCYLDFLKSSNERLVGLALCKGAESMAPSKCFKYFTKELGMDTDVSLIACIKSKNSIPQKCFKKAKKSYSASDTYLAILCSAATSMMPLKCMNEIKRIGNYEESIEMFKVCSRAQDLTPAKCYTDIVNNSDANKTIAIQLCPQHK
ncbi:MAG: hypothetical protein HN576_05195 [Bacteriovoracaceae bacterium]|nr:hypothetical protein [Bacteriovoracaceae bacterium]